MTSGKKDPYLVLARKYRSRTFEELIGQDALVTTLRNAIQADRIHHAYVLTGIRGTGKTSTARLLAMALNCDDGPAVTWDENDTQVKAIAEGRHVDVLEFDAASHTGVDDIRELFEGVAYAPVQGRFKVYIIDEVHMLSKQAFNALLKTLEEPPEKVKFIFATTEVNKIPVTVLSRCQRFDLKRIPAQTLAEHYASILQKEGIEADDAAVQMVAKAADGSVRDGLSLLDQAIALAGGEKISAENVGAMLGMADRARVYDLFEALMSGDAAKTLEMFDTLYAHGFDPQLLMRELLGLSHLVTRLKVVPGLKDSSELSELERTRAAGFAENLQMENLSRCYQMLLHGANEAKQADRPQEAVAMVLMRVCHLAPLPSVSSLLEQSQSGEVATAPVKKPVEAQSAPVAAAKPEPVRVAEQQEPSQAEHPADFNDWAGLVKAVRAKDATLGAMLEQQVSCHGVEDGALTLSVRDGIMAATSVVDGLRQALKELSGRAWTINLQDAAPNAPKVATLAETKQQQRAERIEQVQAHPDIKKILSAFPDAEVVNVKTEES